MNRTFRKLLSLFLCITILCGGIPFVLIEANAEGSIFQKGDIIKFGSYPQSRITDINGLTENEDYVTVNDNYYAIEPIEWVVLDTETGFCMSKYGLDNRVFNDSQSKGNDYSASDIRAWLTGDFYNTAFSESEKTLIVQNSIVTYSFNSSTQIMSTVNDKIFLLSVQEADNLSFFANNSERLCDPTAYAVAHNAYVDTGNNNKCYYWLRSPGESSHLAVGIGTMGSIDRNGYEVYYEDCIRPCIYLNMQYNYNISCDYDTVSNTLTISGAGPMEDYSHSSYPWAEYTHSARTVVIEDGITSVASCAFSHFDQVETIYLPKTIKNIDEQAFQGCGVSTVYYGGSPADKAAISVNETGNICLTYATWWYYYVPAEECTGTFDEATGTLTVSGAGYMEESLENTVPSWDEYRNNIRNIIISDGITSISDNAFQGYSALESITLPKTVTRIADYAFRDCNSLTTVNYRGSESDKAYIVVNNDSGNDRFTQATWNYNYIDPIPCEYTFDANSRVLTIFGEGEMRDYGATSDWHSSAAWGEHFTEATSIVVTEGITRIGDYAFLNFHNVTSISLPDSLTSIGAHAFEACFCVDSLNLTENITEIGDYAFSGCNSMTVTVHPCTIGANAFDYVGYVIFTDTRDVWRSRGGGNSQPNNITYAGVGYCGENIAWTLVDGTLNISGTGSMTDYESASAVPWYSQRNNITNINIGSGITSIGAYAFYGLSGITSVTVPEGVTSVGAYAFACNSNLVSVSLPTGLTALGHDAFSECFVLETINLPVGLTEIPVGLFYHCYALNQLTLPKSVTKIGNYAFVYCRALTLNLYGNITQIGTQALSQVARVNFAGSSSTFSNIGGSAAGASYVTYGGMGQCGEDIEWVVFDTTFTVSGSGEMFNYEENSDRPYNSFASSVTKIEVLGNISTLGKRAFDYFNACTSYDIQSPITTIGQWAFGTNTKMTSFTVPETVTTIGRGAFGTCRNLVSFTFPEGVTAIPEDCFEACTSLTTVNLHSGVTSIGVDAFTGCSALTGLTIPESVTSIGSNAFYNVTNTITYEGSESEWQAIDGYANCGSTNIYCVYQAKGTCSDDISWYIKTGTNTLTVSGTGAMPNYSSASVLSYMTTNNHDCSWNTPSVDSLPEQPWNSYASTITKVVVTGVTSIGNFAFACLSAVTEYDIADTVTSYGEFAFFANTSLQTFTMKNSVVSVGNNAFNDCRNLDSVTFSNTLQTLGDNAFCHCKLVNVSIPDSVTYVGASAFRLNEWTLKSVKFPKNLKTIKYATCQECYNLNSITFPEDLEVIENNAFLFARFYDGSLNFPDTLTYIGDHAFRYAHGLKELTIPAGVTHIGFWAFRLAGKDVDSFTLTILSDGDLEWSSSFVDCAKLTSVTLTEGLTSIDPSVFSGCTGLTSINIPSTVTTIGENAFNGCSALAGLTLPSGITSVGSNAFSSVTNTITYVGSSAQWATVSGYNACGATNINFTENIVSFNTNGKGIAPESVIVHDGETVTSPSISNTAGYVFSYWYLNNENTPFNFNTPITVDTVLYAKWVSCSTHNWGEWVTTENASATKTGKMQRVCSICGMIEEVTIPKYIADYPTSVTLDKTNLTLSVGDVEELKATVSPDTATNKNVVWESSNTKVAKVVNGGVFALAPGYAIITVSTVDERYTVCQATCTVHVTAISVLKTSTYIDNEQNLISGISPNLDSLSEYITVIDGYSLEYSTEKIGTGTKVDIVQGGKVVDTYTALVYGDVNGDGIYDGTDAMVVNCIVNGMLTREQVGEAVWAAADCNHDGVIDNLDVALLNEAGILLSSVDQSKGEEELETSSVYQEYLELIDQSPTAEEPVENPVSEINSFFDIIINLISIIRKFITDFFGKLF